MRTTLLGLLAVLLPAAALSAQTWRRYYYPSEPSSAGRWNAGDLAREARRDRLDLPPGTMLGPYWYGGTYSYWRYLRATDPRANPDPWPYRWGGPRDGHYESRDRNHSYFPGPREPRGAYEPARPSLPESTGRRWYEHEQPRGTSPRWFDRSGLDEGSRRYYDRPPADRPSGYRPSEPPQRPIPPTRPMR